MQSTIDQRLNSFALRAFRDIADHDYVAARLCYRAQLSGQFLWASQQAIEKYLKCILLLNRIEQGKDVFHDLGKGLIAIETHGKLILNLAEPTKRFIRYVDRVGQYRYAEASYKVDERAIVKLDRAVWELRCFCSLDLEPRRHVLIDKQRRVPRVILPGGVIESIIDDSKHPARKTLIWQNRFFGQYRGPKVSVPSWDIAYNSPLFVDPGILDHAEKYIFLSKPVKNAYLAIQKPGDGSHGSRK